MMKIKNRVANSMNSCKTGFCCTSKASIVQFIQGEIPVLNFKKESKLEFADPIFTQFKKLQ